MCEQFGWTERQLREENTVDFVRKIGVYNELKHKASKVDKSKGSYKPATPKIGIVGA